MARGINKSKIEQRKINRNGYSAHPFYSRYPKPPTAKQIAFLKDIWQILNENGIDLTYDKRALVEMSLCQSNIRRAYKLADEKGIRLKKEKDDGNK